MKKVFSLFAVALLLLAVTWDPAEARENPYEYKEIFRDTGEDHPWGGGSEYDPSSGSDLTSTGSHFIVTDRITLDMFLWKLFSPLIINQYTRPSTNYEIVPITETTNPDQPVVNESNRSSK